MSYTPVEMVWVVEGPGLADALVFGDEVLAHRVAAALNEARRLGREEAIPGNPRDNK